MYKWHLYSTVGHSRPLASDISRVADGIAASLRQFSVEASRTIANDGGARLSRTQRSAEVIREINSLEPSRPKGIDARSLAARPPPQAFTIRRVEDTSREGSNNYATRGAGTFRERGALRGENVFLGRGRGLPRGRGRGGARDRGRGAKGKRRNAKGMSDIKREQETDLPWSKEEIEWQDTGHQLAWAGDYKPQTSLEELEKWRPAIASGSAGLARSVMYKMEVATGNLTQPLRHAKQHLERLSSGTEMTLFESDEARVVAQAFKDQKRQAIARRKGETFIPKAIGTLSEGQQEVMLKSWVAGHYEPPSSSPASDVLAQVELYSKRNETYFAGDARKLLDKIRSILPTPPKQNLPTSANPV